MLPNPGGGKEDEVKALTLPAALVLLQIVCSNSSAQVFHQYPAAPTVESGRVVVGPYIGGGDDLFRAGGYIRVGLHDFWDVGAEGVVDNDNGHWRAGAAGDLKLRVFPTNKAIPFDLSVSAGVGFVTGDNVTVIHAPIGAVVSVPLKRENGQMITPYFGAYAVIVNTEVDRVSAPDFSDTNVDPSLRLGLSAELAGEMELFGTFQLGPDQPHGGDLFLLGLNVRL